MIYQSPAGRTDQAVDRKPGHCRDKHENIKRSAVNHVVSFKGCQFDFRTPGAIRFQEFKDACSLIASLPNLPGHLGVLQTNTVGLVWYINALAPAWRSRSNFEGNFSEAPNTHWDFRKAFRQQRFLRTHFSTVFAGHWRPIYTAQKMIEQWNKALQTFICSKTPNQILWTTLFCSTLQYQLTCRQYYAK